MNEYEMKKYKVNKHQTYLHNHIVLLNKIAKLAFGKEYVGHDSDKVLGNSPDWYILAYAKRNIYYDKEYALTEEDLKDINRAIFLHTKINPHHPEFWDDSLIDEDSFDFENPPSSDCSAMPIEFIKELACDWCAVALKKNEPLMKWYNKTVGKRYKFTKEQQKQLKDFITIIANAVEENHLHYPDVDYTCKNADIEKLTEDGEACGGIGGGDTALSGAISSSNTSISGNFSSNFADFVAEKPRKIINLSKKS